MPRVISLAGHGCGWLGPARTVVLRCVKFKWPRSFDSSFGSGSKPAVRATEPSTTRTASDPGAGESDDIARVSKPTPRPRHPGVVGSPSPLPAHSITINRVAFPTRTRSGRCFSLRNPIGTTLRQPTDCRCTDAIRTRLITKAGTKATRCNPNPGKYGCSVGSNFDFQARERQTKSGKGGRACTDPISGHNARVTHGKGPVCLPLHACKFLHRYLPHFLVRVRWPRPSHR